jgi:hypothetical protein
MLLGGQLIGAQLDKVLGGRDYQGTGQHNEYRPPAVFGGDYVHFGQGSNRTQYSSSVFIIAIGRGLE